MTGSCIIDCLFVYSRAAGACEETQPLLSLASISVPRAHRASIWGLNVQNSELKTSCMTLESNTHSQTEHPSVLLTISLLKKMEVLCFDSRDLGVKRKGVLSSPPSVLLLHFYVPMSELLHSAHPNSLSLCKQHEQDSVRRTHRQTVPSNLCCVSCTHTSYLGWRNSSQCHFQFG